MTLPEITYNLRRAESNQKSGAKEQDRLIDILEQKAQSELDRSAMRMKCNATLRQDLNLGRVEIRGKYQSGRGDDL